VTGFDELGADRLRAVVTDFYRRVFDDVMIGFLFVGHDRARLIEREYELSARMLGGDVAYRGRPLRQAHARVPILGGHFDRRLQILKDALAAHDVPAHLCAILIEHTVALRAQVTSDSSSDCNHLQTSNRTQIVAPATLVKLGKR
jgi:hemoglobin